MYAPMRQIKTRNCRHADLTFLHFAVYGANDLAQANTVFMDSSFGMGYNLRELSQVCAGM